MIIAIIPAKKGSNRLPEKNMRLLMGKPMIQYALDYVKQSKRISKIYVSTDDVAIADFAKAQGVAVVFRPESLGGETPLLDVYRHALNTLKLSGIETVAGVQPDHPDRTITLDQALEIYETQNLDVLFSKDAKGQKNGAHSVMNAKGILTNRFKKTAFIVDDCTNILYEPDLMLAEQRLISQDLI